MSEETVNVRYMVNDVEEAVDFYTRLFGFEVLSSAAPAFADVRRGPLRLLLSGPQSWGGGRMPTVAPPPPAGGTGSTSSSRTSMPRSSGCAGPGWSSGTT